MRVYNITPENDMTFLAEIQSVLAGVQFPVAITGAGISTASGLPLLEADVCGLPLRDLFRRPLWRNDAELYFTVYRSVLMEWRTAQPNAAHTALAEHGFYVVTQNVDGLHRDAGSDRLLEIHGNLRELECERCQSRYGSSLVWEERVPMCPQCSSVLKPGIVFEGEEVRHFSRAVDWVGRADVLFVVGTKLEMHPVRELLDVVNGSLVCRVEVNAEAERVLPHLL